LIRINRELPEWPQFPAVHDHGRTPDGRMYLIASLFEELPLAASVAAEPTSDRLVGHLRTTLEVARAAAALHGLPIFHVDLNPMNILSRTERGRPWIRNFDFESSYDVARHSAGEFYDPPTTPGFSAPEIGRQPPDARADVYSLGAVLYTLIAGYGWTWESDAGTRIERDAAVDPDLQRILLGAVAQDPDRRTATMEAFSSSVAKYLEQIWPGRS
jgi:serine/threonine protein kinase